MRFVWWDKVEEAGGDRIKGLFSGVTGDVSTSRKYIYRFVCGLEGRQICGLFCGINIKEAQLHVVI
jgi:hypothetical protein